MEIKYHVDIIGLIDANENLNAKRDDFVRSAENIFGAFLENEVLNNSCRQAVVSKYTTWILQMSYGDGYFAVNFDGRKFYSKIRHDVILDSGFVNKQTALRFITDYLKDRQ